VSLSGNHIVVGTNIGRAYIYQRADSAGWEEHQRLPDTSTTPIGLFGEEVSIDGDQLVASHKGAPPWSILFGDEDGTWQRRHDLLGATAYVPPIVTIHERFCTVANAVYAVRDHNDLEDHAAFQNCFGVSAPWGEAPACELFDLTGDGHLDLGDFEDLVGTLTGP
jgi:hypothetical protein